MCILSIVVVIIILTRNGQHKMTKPMQTCETTLRPRCKHIIGQSVGSTRRQMRGHKLAHVTKRRIASTCESK